MTASSALSFEIGPMSISKLVALTIIAPILFLGCSSDGESEENASEDMPNTDLTSEASSTDSNGNLYEVGFNQVSSINQDPFVRKKNANGESIWYIEHEKSEVDGRAVLVFVDPDNIPWVVFTLVGGSYSEDYLTVRELSDPDAFTNVYAGSYGNGGGAKVSIIARLDSDTGKIDKGTFITARKNDGKTNGLKILDLGMNEGRLAFNASTAAWPPGEGTGYTRFPDITDADRIDNSFEMYYEMDTELRTMTKAVLKRE